MRAYVLVRPGAFSHSLKVTYFQQGKKLSFFLKQVMRTNNNIHIRNAFYF